VEQRTNQSKLKTKIMTKINVTLNTKKAGQKAIFTIKFNIADFDNVIELVSNIQNVEDLYSNKLWTVI